jgi:hypothetical protein
VEGSGTAAERCGGLSQRAPEVHVDQAALPLDHLDRAAKARAQRLCIGGQCSAGGTSKVVRRRTKVDRRRQPVHGLGEPDIEVREAGDGELVVEVKGVDMYDPTTGEVRSGGVDQLALWMIDTSEDAAPRPP